MAVPVSTREDTARTRDVSSREVFAHLVYIYGRIGASLSLLIDRREQLDRLEIQSSTLVRTTRNLVCESESSPCYGVEVCFAVFCGVLMLSVLFITLFLCYMRFIDEIDANVLPEFLLQTPSMDR